MRGSRVYFWEGLLIDVPRATARPSTASPVSSTSSPHHWQRRQRSTEKTWLYRRDVVYRRVTPQLSWTWILKTRSESKSNKMLPSGSVLSAEPPSLLCHIRKCHPHSNMPKTSFLRIGMIFRSSCMSVPPKPSRLHAPTTCLTAPPHLCLPSPHVRSAQVGSPRASPSNHRDLAFVDLENLGHPECLHNKAPLACIEARKSPCLAISK